MATTYGLQMTKIRNTNPPTLPDVSDVGGRVRCFNEKVTLASQASGDIIEIGKLPQGARFLFGMLHTTTTLGGTSIAIGITGTAAKYRTAATFTTTDTPTLFGNTLAVGEALTAEEIVILTVSGGSLPASGTLRIHLYYTVD